MNRTLIIVILIVFGTGYCTPKHATTEHPKKVVEMKSTFYEVRSDSILPYLNLLSKIWYEDSFAVEQVCMFNIVETKTERTQEIVVDRYRFNDLRRGWVYEYKHMSDTAVLLRKYAFADSVEMPSGWGFGIARKLLYDTLRPKADTVIKACCINVFKSMPGCAEQLYLLIAYFVVI